MKKIAKQIQIFIKNKVEGAGAKGAIIGLSGGIDSAVSAVLAVKALGKDRVFGLIMPCGSKYNKQHEADAKALCKKFKIKYEVIDLTYPHTTLVNRIPDDITPTALSVGNLSARLRMCMLYYVGQSLGYLICGTENKTEHELGYFTKYGDSGTDFEPIAELYKTEIRQLAKYLGVPKQIITKAPTAGLWDGQTDEGELGVTYKDVDIILQQIEEAKDSKVIVSNFDYQKIEKVLKIIQKSEHKRKPIDVCKLEK